MTKNETMLKNYFKIAWRNLIRDTSYSLINTIGLAIAVGAFILIALFIYDELSYDRYHKDADRLYRVYKTFDRAEFKSRSLATSNLLAPTLEEEISGLKEAARISKRFSGSLVETEMQKRYEDGVLMADPALFDMFSFRFIQGNPETALNRAFTVVLTETAAKRYFGDENPIGNTLSITTRFGKEEYEVTGLLQDISSNTHFSFDLLSSMKTLRSLSVNPENDFESWYHVGSYTYLKLEEGTSAAEMVAQFPAFLSRHKGERARYEKMGLQPVTDIHLYSNFERELQPNSDVRYIYIFGCIAFLILIIAGINYTNLATARSADRAMEVGIHKTLGVTRSQIIFRLLTESLILCTISVILAIGISEALFPLFNNLTGKELSIFHAPFSFSILLLLFTVGFGLANGIYPALMISRYSPGRVLNGEASGKKKTVIRSGLIVFQFAVSVILIVSTLVIKDQLEYISNKRLGFNNEQMISVQASDGLDSKFSVFKDELIPYSSIKTMTFAGHPIPATTVFAMCLYPKGGQRGNTNYLAVGPDFLKTLQIPLVKGQNLDEQTISRELDFFPVLINETAMNEFGWEQDPIGKTFECFSPTPTVVGVVGDFHYESLKNEIEPLVVMGKLSGPRNIFIRVQTDSIRATLDHIEQAWNKIGPGTPFRYSFMDNDYKNLYKAEDRLASLFSYFTFFAIVIACLGLFGLAAFTAQRRTKEIGIRKVLGATVSNIVALLSKDFIKLVALGFLIAVPIAWYAMNQWLADFAYKIEIGPGIFLLAGGVALLIALATVSWQSIRAALANPVDSLRSE